MDIRIKKMREDATMPSYAHPGDAGIDLYAAEFTALAEKKWVKIPVGFAVEIPKGYVGLIWDKSGLSMQHGLKVLGGVIDSGYRGEIQVGILNLGFESHVFDKGDKIAQLLIQPIVHGNLIEAEELNDDTERGTDGFGSTGK